MQKEAAAQFGLKPGGFGRHNFSGVGDGDEFGLGCELGISTQKMHARGPMGLKEMTAYKYVILGNGHIR